MRPTTVGGLTSGLIRYLSRGSKTGGATPGPPGALSMWGTACASRARSDKVQLVQADGLLSTSEQFSSLAPQQILDVSPSARR
jgi:hypothetical protein